MITQTAPSTSNLLETTYNEDWAKSAEGHASQIMRRDALTDAKSHLTTVGTIENVDQCLSRIESQAVEMQNCRPPADNPAWYLQLRLRIFAFIQWLRLDGPEDQHLPRLRQISEQRQCPEIIAILDGTPII